MRPEGVKMKLEWSTTYDDLDNTEWEADSLYHDDGSHFKFRIKQRLENDRIEFYCDSDGELTGTGGGEFWLSLVEAKAAMQKANDNIANEIGNEVDATES